MGTVGPPIALCETANAIGVSATTQLGRSLEPLLRLNSGHQSTVRKSKFTAVSRSNITLFDFSSKLELGGTVGDILRLI